MSSSQNDNLRKKYEGIIIDHNGKSITYNMLTNCEKKLFAIVESISGSLFTILSGLITSLSVNLLTNFIEFTDSTNMGVMFISILKLMACLAFNIAFVLFTIKSTSINSCIVEQYDLLPKKREQEKRSQLLKSFYINKFKLKAEFFLSIVCGTITIVCILCSPFIY